MKTLNKFRVTIIVAIFILVSDCKRINKNTGQQIDRNNFQYDTTFNAAIWKEAGLYVKGRMSKYIVDNKLAHNISKDSLYELLGDPDEIGVNFCNYLIGSKDTTLSGNFLLLHFEMDSSKRIIIDSWISD
jgi:hypothetical protein